jgi:tetratricopeptide (TPR) repeat protein
MTRHRRWCTLVVLILSVATTPARTAGQDRPATAVNYATLYNSGAYDQVIRIAGSGPGGMAATPLAASYLATVLTEMGRPAEGIERTGTFRRDPMAARAVAMAHEALGNLAAADASWRDALPGPDSLRARVELLRLQRDRGAADSAMRGLTTLVTTVQARGGARTASDAHAVAIASRLLGRTDPARFKEALQLYDRAIAMDSLGFEAQAELGELFLEKFNYADARTTLLQVLDRKPAVQRALAAVIRLNAAEGKAPDLLAVLLQRNPNSDVGHALAARRLIEAEQYDSAVTAARRGLVTDSTAPLPWIEIAAARWLAHDTVGHVRALERAHQRLPGSARAEVQLAEVAARNRLYRDAVGFARRGVARDSLDARALALLGINEMRIGNPAPARVALLRAFEIDPYDVWVKNTLDLLDAYANARTTSTEHFDIVVEQGDADLIALYAAPLAEEAYTALTTRYGFTPSEKVRVEYFRSHADFSVRAVGLAGLGALGVAFGNVLAIDEPPARGRGEFSWNAVLWHEFAHTITRGATDNRVPRWVSEGLSVHEERRARASWGGGVTPSLIGAYGAGRLRPVSRLNDGFVQPRFEQEVILSYALAAYVFEMLEERKGMEGIRALLAGYRAGGSTPALMQQIYGLAPAALDSTFDGWFRAKHQREFAAVVNTRPSAAGAPLDGRGFALGGPLAEAMARAEAAVTRKSWSQAIEAARAAARLFPDFVEQGSAHHLLVTAHLAMGDTTAAIAALQTITTRNGDAVDDNLALARLLEVRRDSGGALAAYERATFIDPFDATVQARLGDLAQARGEWVTAVRARRAVIALGPADRANALYRLAAALFGAGDRVSARREVLRALDLAPTFEAAQDLLLTIRSQEKAP